jgi:hypothetical protein
MKSSGKSKRNIKEDDYPELKHGNNNLDGAVDKSSIKCYNIDKRRFTVNQNKSSTLVPAP